MRQIVLADDFLKDNYLSNDARIPVTLLKTNACSPLATNALENNIWDNFSSRTYKDLPSVGSIPVVDPYTGKESQYQMPAGGRGYTRVPSLISVWSTTPLLLNNSVGHFEASPSVEARMRSFNDAIEQLLWPERRAKDEPLTGGTKFAHTIFPWLFGEDGIQLGPIPKGTPVNLLADLDLMSDSTDRLARLQHNAQVLSLIIRLKHGLERLPSHPTDAQVEQIFAGVEPELIKFNKCPDFVVNKGHYFGTDMQGEEPGLSDADKRALIEFMKTF